MTKYTLALLLLLFSFNNSFAQSDGCATATPITIPASGNICSNFTSAGGTADNFTTTCNANAGANYVWFQYTVTGTQNTVTVTPGTLNNLTVVYDATPCSDGTINFCNTATGTNPITIVQANPVGTTVLIGVASTNGIDGTFQLCVTSQTPVNTSAGDNCINAIPYCNALNPLNVNDMNIFTGSANTPSCHLSNPQMDVFITFTATTNGTIAWTANPTSNFVEYDWALYNITNGCPGNEICCNYNFANSNGSNTGMSPGGPGACGTNGIGGAALEFSPTLNAVAGQTYAIRLNNYSGDGTGFVFSWQGTAAIAPSVNFTINPSTVVCATSTVVNIANTSAGTPSWTFGNGNSFTGASPPAQTYNTPGTYPITGTIGGACPSTLTLYVRLFGPITAVSSVTAPTCGSGCNGSAATLSQVQGGDGTFSYLWSTGAAIPSISNQCPGNYTVTVSDGSCPSTVLTVTIPSASSISVSETNSTPTCNASNGSINLSVSGGTAPYTFIWSNGRTTEDINSLSAATYTVTVSDASSCTTVTSITLTSLISVPNITVTSVNNVSCNAGSNGAVNITIANNSSCSSATVVLNEVMYRPPVNNGVDPNAGEYIELIGPPGTNIGCFVLTDGDWTITIPPGTVIPPDGIFTIGNNAVWGAGFFDLDAENCGCFTEDISGNALLILSDAGEYVSLFNNTGTFLDGLIYGTPTATNTPPNGFLTVGGIINTSALIGCPSSVTIPGSASFLTHPVVAANTSIIRSPDGTGSWASQLGGSANACNSPATNSMTYLWSTGATTEDISGLVAGAYTVTATNSSGCTSTASANVTQPSAISITSSSTNITCPGANNGTASVNASGGTGAFSFLWPASAAGQTTSSATNLAAGNYCATVSDANSCTVTQCVIVSNNPFTAISVSNDTAFCIGGSAQLTASGGFSYLWSPSTGLNATDIANPVATPVSTTTYYVDATIASGINLIVNGNFSAGNVGFSSNYAFSPGDVTPQAVYDIIPNPQTSHSSFAACTSPLLFLY